MKKTVIAPGGPIESDELDEAQTALAVATHRDDHTAVDVNGIIYPEGDGIREQVREMLGLVDTIVRDLDGTMDDVTKLRWFVDDEHDAEAVRPAIHEVSSEFFARPHYPTGCLVTVPALPDGAIVELESKATIPADGWTVETITGEEK